MSTITITQALEFVQRKWGVNRRRHRDCELSGWWREERTYSYAFWQVVV